MNWREAERNRLDLLDALEVGFLREVARVQSSMGDRLRAALAVLSTDATGKLKQTVANVSINRSLTRIFNSYTGTARTGLIKWLTDAVKQVLKANRGYFATMVDSVPSAAAERVILESLGVRSGAIVAGGWMDEVTRFNSVRRAVLSRVSGAVLGTSKLTGLLKTIGRLFTGPKGILRKFFAPVARTQFVVIDRTTQNYYSVKVGLNHALWSHTIKDTSTDFCIKRSQHVYTRAVIDSWNALEWPGKRGDVKVDGHGWGCRSHLSWVSPRIAETLGPINTYNG